MPVTFDDMREALEDVLGAYWDVERDDFEMLLERSLAGTITEGELASLKQHSFPPMVVLHNTLNALNGEAPEEMFQFFEDYTEHYRCEDCGHIGHQLDPINPTLLSSFTPGDVIPSGLCKKCGAVAFPL